MNFYQTRFSSFSLNAVMLVSDWKGYSLDIEEMDFQIYFIFCRFNENETLIGCVKELKYFSLFWLTTSIFWTH